MGTVQGMLTAMRGLLGLAEYPAGSNHNKVTQWYGVDAAWCDMAVSYAAAHSDNAAVVGRFAWTVAHAKWFRDRGRWHYGLGGVRAGDVVFFDWSGSRVIDNIDHVGVVEACHSDGTVTVIEGNTSDACMRRRRGPSNIVGYGRPAYDGGVALPASDGILRRGDSGTAVKALQRRLNGAGAHLAEDGVFGPATETALTAFQRTAGLVVDGEYGPASAAALSARLAGRVYAAAKLAVDGQLGPHTISALQRYLNAHGASLAVDGQLGPRTARVLQACLGVRQDGIVGPQTVKALQRRVGATADGSWGSLTTKALQRALNAGRL